MSLFSKLFGGQLLFILLIAAQGGDPAARVKEQAQKMASALAAGDYKTFAHYNNPAILKQANGEDKFVEIMKSQMEQFKAKGITIGKIVVGNPSKMLPAGKELQCTIPQESEVSFGGQTIVTKSALIAISTDGGKNWTFLDTVNKEVSAVRAFLPNLNPAITWPPSQQIRK